MDNFVNGETKEIDIPRDLDIEIGGLNFYSNSSIMVDGWTGEKYYNPSRNAILCSERVYTDPETNIRRFRVNPNNTEPDPNDYYCVAMSTQFAIDAAIECGNPHDPDHDLSTYWGYTFKVGFVDDNGNKYYINVMLVETKNPNEDNTGEKYAPHKNGFIEFITSYDESYPDFNNTKGFIGTGFERSDKDPNVDFDKWFGGDNVKIDSISMYKNGWMISGSEATKQYKIRKDRDGIPLPPDEYIVATKLSIIDSVTKGSTTDPDGGDSRAKKLIAMYCGENISDEEYERLKKACKDKSIVIRSTINTILTYAKSNVATARVTKYDPLILDLDGDGYNIEKKELGANFDLDKNGFAEKNNWTSRDGFLCLDLNGNGAIDDGGELFGDQTLLADGTRAKNGFEALAQYDSNGDGIIDAGDEIFDSLRVWVDADGSNVLDNGTITAYYGDSNFTEDGSNGQVMVYQPKFYYKVVPLKLDPQTDGCGYHLRSANYYISAAPKSGFKLHPAFYGEDGNAVEYILFSAYEGSIYDMSAKAYLANDEQIADFSADKLSSIAGVKPCSGKTQNLTRANAEILAKNRGNGWNSDTIKAESANQMLMIIEFTSFNMQKSIGYGVVSFSNIAGENCAVNTGTTSTFGNSTGSAVGLPGKASVSYRGIENPWGNIWKFIEGLNIMGNGVQKGGIPYVCTDYNYIENISNNNYERIEFTITNQSDYISAFGYAENGDWLFLPSESLGSPTDSIGDQIYVVNNLNGYRIAMLGGRWDYDVQAGMFYLGLGDNANIFHRGCSDRLIYVPFTQKP